MNYKPGGGNKPQPYLPKNHGEHSGEYIDKYSRKYFNVEGKYNYFKCKEVKRVDKIFSAQFHKLPLYYYPNSVLKIVINNCLKTERYYNEKGEVYLDIDYTDHGNPKNHPYVPHYHNCELIGNLIVRKGGDKII